MSARQMVLAMVLSTATGAMDAQPHAHDSSPAPRAMTFTQLDRADAISNTGHPNEYWRYRALRALKIGQPRRAVENFARAARFGDKYSQHSLSLMYWHGIGVERDRAHAYAWSDLAAERGYRDLLLVREKMWLELDDSEREQALRVGETLYGEYSDRRAKPRQEWAMRRGLAMATGSRLGFEKDRIKFIYSEAAPEDVYARERWIPHEYWTGEDRAWRGKVLVLPVEPVHQTDTKPAPR